MGIEFLNKLGISADLPSDQILERLQDKNLEYLERIESCQDQQRLTELRATQQQIEGAIMSLSTGMTLSRQAKTKTDAELASVQPDSGDAAEPTSMTVSAVTYNDALTAFQRGDHQAALPVMQNYAEKGDVQACLLTAHILSQQGKDEDTKRYLFTAARQGEDIAVLMLAQQYYREGNYVSAEKWARTLYDKQYPGSGSLLTSILALKGMTPVVMDPIIKELEWLQGYERYEQVQRICEYIDKCFTSAEKPYIISKLRYAVRTDATCVKSVDSRFGAPVGAESHEQTEKSFADTARSVSTVIAVIGVAAILGVLIFLAIMYG